MAHWVWPGLWLGTVLFGDKERGGERSHLRMPIIHRIYVRGSGCIPACASGASKGSLRGINPVHPRPVHASIPGVIRRVTVWTTLPGLEGTYPATRWHASYGPQSGVSSLELRPTRVEFLAHGSLRGEPGFSKGFEDYSLVTTLWLA